MTKDQKPTGDQIMDAARKAGPQATGRKPMTMILDALARNAEGAK